MRFELSHDLDAPVAWVEQALMSAELPEMLAARLPAIEHIDRLEHHHTERELRRTWRFQARHHSPLFGRAPIPPEWMTWDEHSTYQLDDHWGCWHVVPRPTAPPDAPWRRRFRSSGEYRLSAASASTTRRTVTGTLEISLALFGRAIEQWALSELRKVYAAEADLLGTLSRSRTLCRPA